MDPFGAGGAGGRVGMDPVGAGGEGGRVVMDPVGSGGEGDRVGMDPVGAGIDRRWWMFGRLVEPDRWSKIDLGRLDMMHTYLWLKKAYELKLKNEMKTEAEGSEPDSDDEKVFAFRKFWIDEWSSKWGPLDNVSK